MWRVASQTLGFQLQIVAKPRSQYFKLKRLAEEGKVKQFNVVKENPSRDLC